MQLERVRLARHLGTASQIEAWCLPLRFVALDIYFIDLRGNDAAQTTVINWGS